MTKQITFIYIISTLIIGCARIQLDKPGADAQQIRHDRIYCKAIAGSDPNRRIIARRNAYTACLMERGFILVEKR